MMPLRTWTRHGRWTSRLAAGLLVLATGGCTPGSDAGLSLGPDGAAPPTGALVANPPGHKLSQGEKIRVTVFNEQQLSGEFEIDGLGNIPMPLIGQVSAAGRSVNELEADITHKLKGRYLVNPRVSIEVTSALPVYVMGEVKTNGPVAYKPGLTVVSAIVLAGGYTPRASNRYVEVQRANGGQKETLPVASNALVFPGDVIEVPERYF